MQLIRTWEDFQNLIRGQRLDEMSPIKWTDPVNEDTTGLLRCALGAALARPVIDGITVREFPGETPEALFRSAFHSLDVHERALWGMVIPGAVETTTPQHGEAARVIKHHPTRLALEVKKEG